jgi:hypothetical protein
MTARHRYLLQEVLARVNARRETKGRSPIGLALLPRLIAGADLGDLYCVDTYSVKRHWRRRPSR